MKKAFSLLEIVIVVAVLGILAALTLPILHKNTATAKEATAKDNLRIVRSVIELYAAQHDDIPPGYTDNNPSELSADSSTLFITQLVHEGHYLSGIPENPFNGFSTTTIIGDAQNFPDKATGVYGWIYKPATKEFRIDWPGTDSQSVRYFDY